MEEQGEEGKKGTNSHMKKGEGRTNVQGVIVSTETINDRLVRGRLVTHDPVRLSVLRDGLRCGGTCNPLDIICSRGLCA